MSIAITVFNPGPFYPGQTIEGKVVCMFTSSTNIRGIRLRLRGKEETLWEKEESYTDDVTKDTRYTTVQYTGENVFIELQENLTGQGTQNPGRYEYPFRFLLPGNLPGTYAGTNGRIFYSLKANVDIPMGIDYEDQKELIVTSVVDLNQTPDLPLLNPFQLQDEKTICCWCCADGPITMDVYLERGVYILGETMKLRIEIANLSNESLEQVKIQLKNVIEERVTSPSSDEKCTEAILASEVETGVGAHGNRTYNFNLQIPPNSELPNFETCRLFRQYCELIVEGSLPGPHTDMHVKQKIKLGHVPPRNLGVSAPPLYPTGDQMPYPPGPISNQPSFPGGLGWVNPQGVAAQSNTNSPSAPSKADVAAGYEANSGGGPEPPPPSYNDVIHPS